MYSRPRQRSKRWLWVVIALLVLAIVLIAAFRGVFSALGGGNAAASAPTATPSAASATPTPSSTFSGPALTSGWTQTWYRSPFRATTKQPADLLAQEVFAEPGVLLDNTAAYDHLMDTETPVLVPEGGYAYVAVGALNVHGTVFPAQPRNIYLFVFKGMPSDGDPSTDLNKVLMLSGYQVAAGIYSPMPSGAYVSLDWLEQQIVNGLGNSPNCGSDGCVRATIVVVDLATNSFRSWVVSDAKQPLQWVRVP